MNGQQYRFSFRLTFAITLVAVFLGVSGASLPAREESNTHSELNSSAALTSATGQLPRERGVGEQNEQGPLAVSANAVSTTSVSPKVGGSNSALGTGRFPLLNVIDSLHFSGDSRAYVLDGSGNRLFLTLDAPLQLKAMELLERHRVPWGAIVALDPKTGRVLAIASHSEEEPLGKPVALRATFPAASLFKIITAAAAVERAGMTGSDRINFRGGNYTLSRYNALPNPKLDRRSMTLAEALGKSVNPAFARVGLNNLSAGMLEHYAHSFGFNAPLPFDMPLEMSTFERPSTDYDTARTAAGFGPVTVSPLHAAALTGSIANNGLMMRPYIVDRVVSNDGKIRYQAKSSPMRTTVSASTARELLSMMQSTVETGTARRQFVRLQNPLLRSESVAGKTGTLSGTNPKGVYHWFVAAAPASAPEIAIATLVIDPGTARVKSTALGREILEQHFRGRQSAAPPKLAFTAPPPAESSVRSSGVSRTGVRQKSKRKRGLVLKKRAPKRSKTPIRRAPSRRR